MARTSAVDCSNEKLVSFLHDKSCIQADLYALFTRIMKLGVKNTYIDTEARLMKGRFMMEDNSVFFAPEINVSKYTFLYVRCFRMLSVILKTVDPELFESLREKAIEPPMLFM